MNSCTSLDHQAALASCVRGELWALRTIVEVEGGALNAMVLRIVGESQVARAVLKEAMLQVFRDAGSFDPRLGSARGWIFAVVRQLALARRRTQEVERRLALVRASGLAALPAPVMAAGAPPADAPQSDPIALAFFDGYNREQIAGMLHESAAGVRLFIRGGLSKLMDRPA